MRYRIRITRLLAVGGLALVAAGCAIPQPSAPAAPPPPPPPLKLCALPDAPPKDVAAKPGYVQYAVTVIGEDGKPVDGLKRSDFMVSADTQSLPITYFRDDKDAMPASLAIIVDTSGSMVNKLTSNDKSRLDSVRDGIRGVLGSLNACDEVAVLIFEQADSQVGYTSAFSGQRATENKVNVIEPLSTDHTASLATLYAVKPFGQTPLYDSIDEAEHLLQNSHYPDGAILVITDGLDNSSEIKEEDLLHEVVAANVPLYAIGIGSEDGAQITFTTGPFNQPVDSDAVSLPTLQKLVAASPGHVWLVSPIDQDAGDTLVAALTIASHSLGHAYTIGFVATGGTIPRITVNNQPETYVHAHPESLAAK